MPTACRIPCVRLIPSGSDVRSPADRRGVRAAVSAGGTAASKAGACSERSRVPKRPCPRLDDCTSCCSGASGDRLGSLAGPALRGGSRALLHPGAGAGRADGRLTEMKKKKKKKKARPGCVFLALATPSTDHPCSHARMPTSRACAGGVVIATGGVGRCGVATSPFGGAPGWW